MTTVTYEKGLYEQMLQSNIGMYTGIIGFDMLQYLEAIVNGREYKEKNKFQKYVFSKTKPKCYINI